MSASRAVMRILLPAAGLSISVLGLAADLGRTATGHRGDARDFGCAALAAGTTLRMQLASSARVGHALLAAISESPERPGRAIAFVFSPWPRLTSATPREGAPAGLSGLPLVSPATSLGPALRRSARLGSPACWSRCVRCGRRSAWLSGSLRFGHPITITDHPLNPTRSGFGRSWWIGDYQGDQDLGGEVVRGQVGHRPTPVAPQAVAVRRNAAPCASIGLGIPIQ